MKNWKDYVKSAYAFSIDSEDENREDQKSSLNLHRYFQEMYLEKVKEAYKQWKLHQRRVL